MTPLSINSFLSSGRPAHEVLFFHTPLCGTCQLGEQMLMVVEQALTDQVCPLSFHSCRVAEWQQLVQAWKIESVPALVLLKDGKLDKKVYAFQSVSYLYDTIKTSLLN